MSYYSGYGGYSSYSSGLTSGYSGYSSYKPSYDYSSSRYDSSYSLRGSSQSSSYKPKTYDFSSSSFLSKNYGSSNSGSHYSRKYDEYSWTAKDLLTDIPSTEAEKIEFNRAGESQDKVELVNSEGVDENSGDSSKESFKDYSRDISSKEDKTSDSSSDFVKRYSRKEYSIERDTKENGTRESSSDLSKSYSRTEFSSDAPSKEDKTNDGSRDSIKDYSRDRYTKTNDSHLVNGYSGKDYSRDYSSRKSSKEANEDGKDDYLIRGSRKMMINDGTDKKYDKVDSNGLDTNRNYIYNKKDNMHQVDSSLNNLSLRDGRGAGNPTKKVFNFEEEDEVFIKPQNTTSVESGRESLFKDLNRPSSTKTRENVNSSHREKETPPDRYSSFTSRGNDSTNHRQENRRIEKPKSKSTSDVTDSGPLRMHRQGVAKFISAIPDQKRYVSSVNFLPDRIELRFTGAPPQEKKMKRCRSITDLYEITVEPEDDGQPNRRIHPWEETIQCQKQEMAYAYDSENEILHYTKHKHEHTKEMYISQYTHYFDPEEPQTHIAGWKCDVEPNGIPHERSRMCVMKSPVVSDSRRHIPRPKSAPPQLFGRPVSPEETIRSQKVNVYERGKDDDVFFVDGSAAEEVSSIGYAPSDDTSDSSAFFFNDPHFLSRYQQENQDKDQNLAYSKPRLIRLSAEFPGIRNLEKMRRKRQSMGSYSSGDTRSSVDQSPTPRNGEYGFYVALTSGDPRKPQQSRRPQRSSYNR